METGQLPLNIIRVTKCKVPPICPFNNLITEFILITYHRNLSSSPESKLKQSSVVDTSLHYPDGNGINLIFIENISQSEGQSFKYISIILYSQKICNKAGPIALLVSNLAYYISQKFAICIRSIENYITVRNRYVSPD